jgi:hypothetical protein
MESPESICRILLEKSAQERDLRLPFIFQIVVAHTTIVCKTAVYARRSDRHHDDFTQRT